MFSRLFTINLLILVFINLLLSCVNDKERVVFIGDSLIQNWDEEKYFPFVETINEGVDGYTISDCSNANLSHEGSTMVVLVGTNDLNNFEDIKYE